MSIDNQKKTLLVRYLSCWGVLLLSLVLFPLISWPVLEYRWLPDMVGQLLLFWPQYLFVPNGFTHEATLGERIYLPEGASYLAIFFWILALGGYVTATRRFRGRVIYAWLLPFVLVLSQIGVYGVLSLLGVGVVLDGP